MDMYAGSEQRIAETYMIPTSGSNPQLAYIPHIEEIDYVGNEVAPEFIFDQGLYYPATNYYGYYSTGFESPGQWDGNNRVFGLDGQDLQYSGLQTENLPYVYYTPSYGYAQSPFGPYNAYTHGAVVGLDGSYVGTEQYGTTSTYQPQASSPAYVPIVVQPSTGATPNNMDDPLSVSTGVSVGSRHVHGGLKYTPLASVNTSVNSQRNVSGNAHPETSQSSQTSAKSAEGSVVNALTSKLSVTQGSSLNSVAQVTQDRSSSGQSTNQLSHGRSPSVYNPLKVTLPSNDGFNHFGSNVHGWAAVDTFRPSLHHNGVLNSPSGSTNILGDQNAHRPRTIRSRRQWVPSIIDGTHLPKSDDTDGQQSIIIDTNKYNRDDFQVNCPNAKFFVIKSYSEDDVHKSIKYNVWSSTPNGNRKLQSAYEDALRISPGLPRNCRIFLFFSVNASGQFCGVAEMIGPVDFNNDMSFWQQDKWTGSFPVKWHIVKDVPNTSFRHIILENNENKPVTNSRDTQEIPYLPGINMLNIFKSSLLRTSILDDFKFYEDRERTMQEEKARLFGGNYNASQFLPAIFPVNRTNSAAIQTNKADGQPSHGSVSYPINAVEGQLFSATEQPTKVAGKQPNNPLNHSKKIDEKAPNGRIEQPNSSRKPPTIAVNQNAKAEGERPSDTVHPPKVGTKQPDNAVYQSQKADSELVTGSIDQPPKTSRTEIKPRDAITTVGKPLKADRNAIKTKDLKSNSDLSQNADTKDRENTNDLSSKSDTKSVNSSGDQIQNKDANSSKDPNTMCTAIPDHEQVTQKNGLTNQLGKADAKAPKGTVRQSLNSSGKSPNSSVNQPPNGKPQDDAVHPPIVDSKKINRVLDQSSKPSGKQPNGSVDQPLKTASGETNLRKESVITNAEPFKADGNKTKVKDSKSTADQLSKAGCKDHKNHKDPKTMGRTGPRDEQYVRKDSIQLSNNKNNAKADHVVYASAMDSKEGEASSTGSMLNEIVTIGSMRIKVKGPSEPSPGIITVGTIPIDPKGLKVNQHGSLRHQK